MELMVVLAIVAILAAIAIPAYTDYVERSRRSDAQAALLNTASQLEQCYTMSNDYTDANCAVTFPVTSPEGFYSVTAPTLTAQEFELSAAPAPGSPQTGDADCATLTLDQLGRKGATGNNPGECWGR